MLVGRPVDRTSLDPESVSQPRNKCPDNLVQEFVWLELN